MSTPNEIRGTFLKFFEDRGHRAVSSSSLVPANDPTLMFTNAGMVQFKDVFTQQETRPYKRAATSQKCLRVSGKHNDLDQVGRTARHHTFFEMLGNFSFGDYFKADAIAFAHELLIKVYGIDPKRLVYTVFRGEGGIPADDEARDLWKKIAGVGDERVIGMGKKDNFWSMGDTGPQGPCSEIHYFIGDGEPDLSRFDQEPGPDGSGWIEIWNLVFMQFEVREKGGALLPLPAPSIDTGMGLERLAAVLAGERANYHTGLFWPLLDTIGGLAKKTYNRDFSTWSQDDNVSMRVIADHARTATFCMADGVFPANTGREYVLRRVMRRALSHGYLLGIREPFFDKVIEVVISEMGDAYPDLKERRETILAQARREERSFQATIERSVGQIEKIKGDLGNPALWGKTEDGARLLSGKALFTLKDTYGSPVELTSAIGKREGFEIDEKGFEGELEKQKEKSRANQKVGSKAIDDDYKRLAEQHGATQFLGYDSHTGTGTVLALLRLERDEKGELEGRERVQEALEGDELEFVVHQTPFYGESGGQVGDTGEARGPRGALSILDTQKPAGDVFVHRAKVREGRVSVGEALSLTVDEARRRKIRTAHSATHLLQYALKKVLGGHVAQKGSVVEPERLRFDFSHDQAPTPDELRAAEEIINQMIRDNQRTNTAVLPLEEAKQQGAVAMFGEKYGERVRAIHIHHSFELCGGTHVSATGDIGLFKISGSSPVGAGVRRIEALTGGAALSFVQQREEQAQKLASLLRCGAHEVLDKVSSLAAHVTQQQRELNQLRDKMAANQAADILGQVKEIAGVKVLAARAPFGDRDALRDFGDKVRDKLQSGVVFLAGVEGDKANLLCLVTKDLVSRYKAGDLLKNVLVAFGARGGGKPEKAEGGLNADQLDAAFRSFLSLF